MDEQTADTLQEISQQNNERSFNNYLGVYYS